MSPLDVPDTTRRYPRTLVDAFPSSEGYHSAFEPPSPTRPLRERVIDAVCWIVSIAAFAVMLTAASWWH